MEASGRFEFVVRAPVRSDAVVDGRVASKQGLLSLLAEQLLFPDYFGENWDALLDCLGDLSWCEREEVAIDHPQLPSLSSVELGNYLDVLVYAVDRRDVRGAPRLRVIFREDDRGAVEALLRAVRDSVTN